MKTMTRPRYRLAIAAVAAATALTACGGGSTGADGGLPSNVSFGGGASGAIYGVLATGMAEIVNTNLQGVNARAEATAGGLQNTRLVRDGELTFGLTDPRVVYPAVRASGEFADEPPAEDLRFVMNGYPSLYQVTALDPNIRSIADLRGKRVCTAAGIQTAMLGELLTPYGLAVGDLSLSNLEWTECADRMKAGDIDVIGYAGGPGAAVLIQAFAGSPTAHVVGIDPDKATAMSAQFPWWKPSTLPAGTYDGQTAEVPTVEISGGTLVTRADTSEELVHQFLTALESHFDQFSKVHPLASYYSLPGTATNTMSDVLPTHPGAARFYRDKGIPGY